MSDFKDFDLDLKKVASAAEGRELSIWTSELLTQFSVKHCSDPSNATTPTTGVTTGCCTKKANDVEPNCV